jgi:SAM-dependent MidA family methyltransferase
MVAVWIAYFLHKIGVIDDKGSVTKKFRIVELGPGRGLLMRDIVKSLHEMKIEKYFDINFIEGNILFNFSK